VSLNKQRPVFVMDMQCCLCGRDRRLALEVSADAGSLRDRAVVVGDSIKETCVSRYYLRTLIILEIISIVDLGK
jgi:hypothetical protein